jgi:branched-chain amino acid transport system ATP-binding protein
MAARAGSTTHVSDPSVGGTTDVLEARGVHVHFEGVRAIDGVDLELRRGEILGLIGPNGAGKTTLVNALTGFQYLTAGRILLAGQDVTAWPPARLAVLPRSRTVNPTIRIVASVGTRSSMSTYCSRSRTVPAMST